MHMKIARILKDNRGFTLMELIVVVIILGLLAAIVGQRVIGQAGKAKTHAAQAQIKIFSNALTQFRLDTGLYPTTQQGLEALVKDPGVEHWDGPYLEKNVIPADPWGQPYRYEHPGSHGDFDLYTYGLDKAPGGEKENQDATSWQ